MDAFQVCCWVLAYIGYLFIQSFIINGIKLSAHGETEVLPDGTEKDSNMILYPLQKYLLQYKNRKVFYTQQRFDKLWEMLKHKYIKVIPESVMVIDNKISVGNEDDVDVMKKLGYVFERDHEIKWQFDGEYFMFYKEVPQFKFSRYLRMPIIQCIKCMSSFWSIFFTFLPVMVYFFGWQWWLLPLGIFNIFALTYLNYRLYRAEA